MSFKRAAPKTNASVASCGISSGVTPKTTDRISGVKPWINGQHFVSSGLRQLDEIIGGGNALGTLCIIEEDRISNHGEVLFNYSIAEAVSHGHPVLIVDTEQRRVLTRLNALPYNLNFGADEPSAKDAVDKSDTAGLNHSTMHMSSVSWVTGKESGDQSYSDGDVLMTPDTMHMNHSLASIGARAQHGVVYCNSFDLSRR